MVVTLWLTEALPYFATALLVPVGVIALDVIPAAAMATHSEGGGGSGGGGGGGSGGSGSGGGSGSQNRISWRMGRAPGPRKNARVDVERVDV